MTKRKWQKDMNEENISPISPALKNKIERQIAEDREVRKKINIADVTVSWRKERNEGKKWMKIMNANITSTFEQEKKGQIAGEREANKLKLLMLPFFMTKSNPTERKKCLECIIQEKNIPVLTKNIDCL